MHVKLVQSFPQYKGNLDGLLWLNGVIWTVSGKSSRMISQREKAGGELDLIEEIGCVLKNPGGLAWDGSRFLVLEKVEKAIYTIDSRSKQLKMFLDLLKTKPSAATQILKAASSTVPDIAFHDGNIWITCQAGYSSSVCCFDGQSKKLVKKFFTRGPKPAGISFETTGRLAWVLDASNKELSQFDPSGKWTGNVLKVPLEKPAGLTIDDQGMFWMADLSTKKICQLRKEA
jgi:hypothetical protein